MSLGLRNVSAYKTVPEMQDVRSVAFHCLESKDCPYALHPSCHSFTLPLKTSCIQESGHGHYSHFTS